MNQLGEQRRIPLLNMREGDVGILLALPIGGLLVASSLGLEWLVVPLMLIGVTIGVTIIYAAPVHLPASTWLTDVCRYYFCRPAVTLSRPPSGNHAETAGGLVEYAPFSPSERTQDLTSVQRAWPGTGAVQRDDRTMEAFLEVEPTNMGFAMSGDWERVQQAGEQFANSDLDFSLTLHTTTRAYPADRLVAQLEDRLEDQDVATNPAFRELIEEYHDRRPSDLAETREHHYYLGVAVTPLDVHSEFDHERTPGEKLADVPGIGHLFRPFVERREQRTAAARRAAMFDALDDRLKTVRTELVEDLPGWSATRLSTLETFLLATSFWRGREFSPETGDQVLRTDGSIGRSPRGDAS